MQEALAEILRVGISGAVAVLFVYLYLNERKEHNVTRQKHIDSILDRLGDAKQTGINLTEPIRALGVSLQAISDKIVADKDNKR